MKTCTKCNTEKPLEHFRKNTSWCINCYNIYQKLRRQERMKDPVYVQQQIAKCRLRDHNLTSEQFQKMLEAQKGQCKICECALVLTNKRTHIDHDHITGEIRGLLCCVCNHLLGCARDRIPTLSKAIAYLLGFPNRLLHDVQVSNYSPIPFPE